MRPVAPPAVEVVTIANPVSVRSDNITPEDAKKVIEAIDMQASAQWVILPSAESPVNTTTPEAVATDSAVTTNAVGEDSPVTANAVGVTALEVGEDSPVTMVAPGDSPITNLTADAVSDESPASMADSQYIDAGSSDETDDLIASLLLE
jgi:hypothetical protein